MKDSKYIIPALLVAVGLLALGLCIKSGMNSIVDRNRVVEVRGLAEMEVKANKVTWPLTYQMFGADLTAMYPKMEQCNKSIVDFLSSHGITTDEISIGAPSVTDNMAYSYNNYSANARYNVTVTLTITSTKVDLVQDLIKKQGELLKQGVPLSDAGWHETIYEYTSLNDIKPQMIAEATKNAHAAAEKFAEDSGSKVGKIKDAHQGQFSITDRDPYTPSIKNVRVVTYVNYYIED